MYWSYEGLVESLGIQTPAYCAISFGYYDKAIAPLATLSTPSGASIWLSYSLSSPFFNDSCSVYTMHLGGTWYGFVLSLNCKDKVPLKYQIPVNT